MYAMINFGGTQYKAVTGEKLFVDNLNKEIGEIFENTNVMLLSEESGVTVGKPYIDNAKVKLEVLNNFQGDKVIIFKKRRRKGYKVKRGFRPQLTKLRVLEISK